MFTIKYVRQWLGNQESYSLQKPVRNRFKTANVRVTSIHEQWEIYLFSMAYVVDANDGIHFLLFTIDILSRRIWIRPLKNKTAKVVLEAMKSILLEQKTKKSAS